MYTRILCLLIVMFSPSLFPSYSFAQLLPLFGPTKYERTTGAPNVFNDSFPACNTGATYKLIIENGEAGKDRISSGAISLNGQEIVRQNYFSQKIEKIEKTVSLQTENTLTIKLASGPGGFIRVSVYCVTNCLEVKITTPVTQTIVNKAKTIIKGDLYNAFSETGVVLNSPGPLGDASALAQTQGTRFAGIMPLQQGQNIITATATDACGYKTTDTVTVNTQTLDEKIRLTANPESGIPTLNVTLEGEAYLPTAISGYSWDTNGDGTPDQTGPNLTKVTAQYQTPGLYFPKVTITDTAGNIYSETAIVNVLSREEMDVFLKGKWDGMKEASARGYIQGAMRYFALSSMTAYQQQFTALSNTVPQIVADMGTITMVTVKNNFAEYDLRTVRNGTTYSFQVLFLRDVDGIWRIKSF